MGMPAIQDAPQSVKVLGDATAGALVAGAWMDYIQGGLEVAGLILAVLYGVARVYDSKLYRDFVAWLRRKK